MAAAASAMVCSQRASIPRFIWMNVYPKMEAVHLFALFCWSRFFAKLLNYYHARALIVSAGFFLRLHFVFFIYCQLNATKKRAAFLHSNDVQIFIFLTLFFVISTACSTIKTRRYTTYLRNISNEVEAT